MAGSSKDLVESRSAFCASHECEVTGNTGHRTEGRIVELWKCENTQYPIGYFHNFLETRNSKLQLNHHSRTPTLNSVNHVNHVSKTKRTTMGPHAMLEKVIQIGSRHSDLYKNLV